MRYTVQYSIRYKKVPAFALCVHACESDETRSGSLRICQDLFRPQRGIAWLYCNGRAICEENVS